MSEDPAAARPAPGEALYRELLWVHDALRRDLARVRDLAAAALDGTPAMRIEAEVGELHTSGPLWRLRTGCLAHCRFVEGHHRLEDVALFPALGRANPDLSPVLEKLAADHRSIADRVAEVEASVAELGEEGEGDGEGGGPAEPRRRLAARLDALAEELLAHLGYEEEQVAETMRGLTAF